MMFEDFENIEQNDKGFEFERPNFIERIIDTLEDLLGIPDSGNALSAETYDYLNGLEQYGDVTVSGQPFETVGVLDYSQGDNSYGAQGCCGLVSSANFLNLCGIEASEEEMVGFALENGLCYYSPFSPASENGGTGDPEIEAVIEAHGVPVTSYEIGAGGSVEDIADAIDEGRAVTIGVNAGYLWNEASFLGDGSANHQITVTGAVRDDDGSVVGLVICDSGRGLESDSCRVVSMEELAWCYETVPGSTAIISDNAVR